MRRAGLVCAMRAERGCLSRHGDFAWDPLEGAPFETASAHLGDTEAVCVVSGIGKAAAAAATQYLLQSHSPALVVSFGLAGALQGSARAGDIVFPASVLQADTGVYDRRGFQHPRDWEESEYRRRLCHEHPADPVVHEWGRRYLRQRGVEPLVGPLVTCDQAVFSSHRRSELRRDFRAVAVDMESGAVAQVAALNRVPFAALRAVSDAHDLEMEDAPGLARAQADSALTRAGGLLGVIRDPRHRTFLKLMREGSGQALERLGELLPGFVEGFPTPV